MKFWLHRLLAVAASVTTNWPTVTLLQGAKLLFLSSRPCCPKRSLTNRHTQPRHYKNVTVGQAKDEAAVHVQVVSEGLPDRFCVQCLLDRILCAVPIGHILGVLPTGENSVCSAQRTEFWVQCLPEGISDNLGRVSSPLCVYELRLACSRTQLCQYRCIYWLCRTTTTCFGLYRPSSGCLTRGK